MSRDQAGDFLAVRRRRHRDRLTSAGQQKDAVGRFAGDQAAQRHCLKQGAGGGVQDVDRVHRFPRVMNVADVLNYIRDRRRRRHTDELGGHNATGAVAGVVEQAVDADGVFNIGECEYRFPVCRLRHAQMIDQTVGRHARNNGRRPITADTALRLGVYFQMDPRFWLNLQAEYDMRIAMRELLPTVAPRIRVLHT